ncbi:MAG: MarR family transcriptional regulator [Rhodobacteraceae bacterium]|uniref:Transcriptional regulator n=1 Tax=Salipiger profundus TaxID=1229727 RepID=A0A1U7D7T0_9RHOB|nr:MULTISPECIES: MarR family transcriptional regulator [Salipiger]APX24168.1 transcriptional regulator [Salipiger profundus]MAB07360.1 MarR family transcriptional regulator [Paracoccaceae bacterium]GFZ95106.1 transcriptional regulator [Salipiger profundus]SFB88981.1 DNA-binding transcriptional regulator, MarR family [Salipiger profundus]
MDETRKARTSAEHGYLLDEQIGFLLRKAYQRNSNIFAETVPGKLTPTQFSVMHRLAEDGPMSQNRLGRSVAMDGATTKGVVDRLIARGLLRTAPDPDDRRRHLVSLTPAGVELIDEAVEAAIRVSAETLAPLREREKETLLKLLKKIGGE